MRILLSNDDGIDAPGLRALEASVRAAGHDLWVVAPEKERSAQSHALTLHKPLRAKARGAQRFAVSGTPADCVYLARHHLMPEAPELVLSGVNRGANLGKDVHYSGTVAAAREAAMAGLPAIAVSLHLTGPADHHHYDVAADMVVGDLPRLFAAITPGNLLNINVPDRPAEAQRGFLAAPLGDRIYADGVDRRVDPWGRDYFWIGGGHARFSDEPDTDGPKCQDGWATITPLHADPTDHADLEDLRERLRT